MNTSFLFASLIWGMAGSGYFLFGKKRAEAIPMLGGLALMAISYLIGSALLLSLASIGLILAMHWLMRRY